MKNDISIRLCSVISYEYLLSVIEDNFDTNQIFGLIEDLKDRYNLDLDDENVEEEEDRIRSYICVNRKTNVIWGNGNTKEEAMKDGVGWLQDWLINPGIISDEELALEDVNDLKVYEVITQSEFDFIEDNDDSMFDRWFDKTLQFGDNGVVRVVDK